MMDWQRALDYIKPIHSQLGCIMNNTKMNPEQNVEVSLENLEINVEQAQIIADEDLSMVTGGNQSFVGDGPYCRRHM